jgi:IS5 family transposase
MSEMDSFFLMDARALVQSSPSMKLHELLNWQAIAAQLKGLYQREISGAGGPEPYCPLGMFKLMLLGQWHGLSDAQLEQALRVRLDFMVFSGFEPSAGELPDASTLYRFRNRLVKAELDQKLLTLINGQLQQRGLKVQGARGAIMDATLIASAARPRRYVEDESGQSQVIDSADRQARWVKKGQQAYYGYRGHPGHPLLKAFNKKIGAVRFKVEQAFGTMKRRFHLARARYFGTAQVQAQMCWAALGMNLLKAHRKLKAMELAGVGAP